MGFLSMQQNVEIPEVSLQVHPIVGTIVTRSLSENRKPNSQDFEKYLNDSNFLNQLQTVVGKWIKEIHKVSFLRNKEHPHFLSNKIKK